MPGPGYRLSSEPMVDTRMHGEVLAVVRGQTRVAIGAESGEGREVEALGGKGWHTARRFD